MTDLTRPSALGGLLLGALLTLAPACGDDEHIQQPDAGVDPQPPALLSPPSLIGNPNPAVPLAAIIDLETDVPVTVRLELSGGGEAWTIAFDQADVAHQLPVLGLKPDVAYSIDVIVRAANGLETAADEPLTFTTDPLPADFPPLQVTVSDPSSMEPGIVLFDVFQWDGPATNRAYGLLVAVDAAGDVVWFYRTTEHHIIDSRRLSSGNILYIYGDEGAREIDMLGNTVRQWHAAGLHDAPTGAIAVATDTIHHEIVELPSGNLLFLSTELRELPDYPTSETDSEAPLATANVIGDLIVEMTRDGTIVNEWSLLDILDPYRIGYGSLSGFWNGVYAGVAPEGTRDWTHANAVIYDARDDSMILSLRHQDAVIKVDRATGDLVWILGDAAGWDAPWSEVVLAPQGGTLLQYHQHAPQITPAGTLMLYDNGNFRAMPFEGVFTPPSDNFSRAVEFDIDEGALTVTQVWAYGGPGETDARFYSPFICDADKLPITGNVLVTDGGRVVDGDGVPTDNIPAGHQWARIVEVTGDSPPAEVFELIIEDTSATSPLGWSVYRSEKLPSIYP